MSNLDVVICARKGSSLADKNIRPWTDGIPLLVRSVRQCRSVFGQCTVLTDSGNYAALAKEAGAHVPYVDEPVSAREDVSVRLLRWAKKKSVSGQILLVQCTSPNTQNSTLEKFRRRAAELRPENLVTITARRFPRKISCLFYRSENGATVSAFPQRMPTEPRQILPEVWDFTGALTLFHVSQLSRFGGIFGGAQIDIVPVEETEALDIDRESDFPSTL